MSPKATMNQNDAATHEPAVTDASVHDANANGAATNDSGFDLAELRQRLAGKQGKSYWRSLDELADTPEFQDYLAKEFPRQAAPLEASLNRRDFVKLLGASLALAGLTACANPEPREKIVPYVRQPDAITPGKPLFFATAVTRSGYAQGVLVESHTGRPTKIEGNPDHPASLGATDVYGQAAILGMYDPDRSRTVTEGGNESDWESFTAALTETLEGLEQGAGLAVLTETVTSPTLQGQLAALQQRFPQARRYAYDPVHNDFVRAGAMMAFGQDVRPLYDFSRADVILSLGADFLARGPLSLRYARQWADRRRVREAGDSMNRLYTVESTPTPTGTSSDHRLSLRPAQIEALARVVAQRLGVDVAGTVDERAVPEVFVTALVDDLRAAGPRAAVIAGDEQPAVVQALAHAINDALGAVGTTVRYVEPFEGEAAGHLESLRALVEDMQAGNVQALVIIGGNPVYNTPADLPFAEALENVPFSAHLSLYQDETSARARWHVPMAHELETWSDARAADGTATIMQPLIAPLYGGKSAHELLSVMLGQPASSFEVIQGFWETRAPGDFDSFWRDTVYRGVVQGTGAQAVEVSLQADFPEQEADDPEALVALFRPDPSVDAGQFANNGWLQELPKPITKLTWDNAVLVGFGTAERLGLSNEDVVEVTVDGRSVEGAVFVLPGQADGVLTLHLGFGRERAGRVGSGVGFNAYSLRPSGNPWSVGGVQLRRTGRRYQLASTQPHHPIEIARDDRHLLRGGTLAEFREHPEHPEFVHPVEHHASDLYPDYQYESYAWGMVIDQTVCTGCSACVVACQAENNVPIVGKQQVLVSREMHWLRVDSYFGGEDPDNPDYFYQPILCMHCEKAPCEPVCPVQATVHDNEGLNVMVYNRCVGTRYCSNNCPYKVRRFNYLDYTGIESGAFAVPLQMMQNPDVTVRSRGVMEKCTYCIQRIEQAYITAENEDRRIGGDEVVTACQAACPTEAIVFGDLNNSEARVTQDALSVLNYGLLEELNTVPRTTYLARVRNPNPALAAAAGETGAH